MKNKFQKGFTVLEFLIVLAIILILLAIILPNLQTAREKSLDEKKVSDMKTISLGLEQFKQACGSYPVTIDKLTPCGTDPNNPAANLGNFIPEIEQYNFVDINDPKYIEYVPFAISSDDSQCIAFHLGIMLKNETKGIFEVGDANKDSRQSVDFPYVVCGDTGVVGFDGGDLNKYDIFKQ